MVYMNRISSKLLWGPSWSWSHGSWIYNYLCNQYLKYLFRILLMAMC